jgi:hypothetical protein
MVRREALARLGLRSTGMEFASEMVVKARLAGLRVAETPVTYSPRPLGARSKLRSIPDGIRHLVFLLGWAPKRFFLVPALCLVLAGAVLVGGFRFPDEVVAGAVLLAAAGEVSQALLWLRLWRGLTSEHSDRTRKVSRWALSQANVVGTVLVAAVATGLGVRLASDSRWVRAVNVDGRTALVLLAVGATALSGAVAATVLRRARLMEGHA